MNSLPDGNLPIPVGFSSDGKDVPDGDASDFVRIIQKYFFLDGRRKVEQAYDLA